MVGVSYAYDLPTELLLLDCHLTIDIYQIQTCLFDAEKNSLVGRRYVEQKHARCLAALLPASGCCSASASHASSLDTCGKGPNKMGHMTDHLQVKRAIVVAFA